MINPSEINLSALPSVALEARSRWPVQEIGSIGASGKVITEACTHDLIPGLDASFCKTCRIRWVDQDMRDRLTNGKKAKAKSKSARSGV